MKTRYLLAIISVLLLGIASGFVYLFVNKSVVPSLQTQVVNSSENKLEAISASVGDRLSTAATVVTSMSESVQQAPLDRAEIMKRIPPVLNQYGNPEIAGGGVWAEARRLDPNRDRDSFFWGRGSSGALEYLDDYNDPSVGLYREEGWYVVGPNLQPGQVGWSQAYQDPVSGVTMVTATAPVVRDGSFWGVCTVDFTLDGLHAILENAAKESSSILVVSDAEGMIIAAPGLRDGLAMKTWDEVSQADPTLKPLAEAVAADKDGVTLSGVLPDDDALFVQYTMPKQEWKVSMLMPTSLALASASSIQSGLFALFIPLLAVFALLLTAISWLALSRVVSTTRRIKQMAAGETTERLADRGRTEVADLRRAVNAYGDHLGEIVKTVVDGADRMTDSAAQLDELSSAMRDRSGAQLEVNAQMDDSVSQLTQAAEEISTNTSAAASRATEARESIRQGAEVITANREAAVRLTETMEQAKTSLGELTDATEKVGGMLNMIVEISEQTNLLALNATIEAARAGEAGKGFAVVASEVGTLAGDTKKATAEIESLLGDFRSSAKETIDIIETSHDISVESKDRAEVVENTYNDISAAFDDIHDRTVSIASAAEEQVAVTQAISGQTGQVRSASEENAQQAEELYRNARTVREVATRLANIRSNREETAAPTTPEVPPAS